MTCPHGFLDHAECRACYPPMAHPLDEEFWGQCEHGASLSPAVECEQCELREDDCDA